MFKIKKRIISNYKKTSDSTKSIVKKIKTKTKLDNKDKLFISASISKTSRFLIHAKKYRSPYKFAVDNTLDIINKSITNLQCDLIGELSDSSPRVYSVTLELKTSIKDIEALPEIKVIKDKENKNEIDVDIRYKNYIITLLKGGEGYKDFCHYYKVKKDGISNKDCYGDDSNLCFSYTEAESVVYEVVSKAIDNSNRIVKGNNNLLSAVKNTVTFESKKANEICNILNKCKKLNISRKLFIYGNPGSGKSTIASQVAIKNNYKTVYLSLDYTSVVDFNSFTYDIIRCYKPELIIIEDIDRHLIKGPNASILKWLESIPKNVFLIATSNTSVLDPAILRPGRFDDVIKVNELQSNIIAKLYNNYTLEQQSIIKDWPVAYIVELNNRMLLYDNSQEMINFQIENINTRVKIAEEFYNNK